MTSETERGAAVRRLRVRAGLTGQEMADRLGISQPAYSNRETGKVPISDEELRCAALALGVQIDQIVAEIQLAHDEQIRQAGAGAVRVIGDDAENSLMQLPSFITLGQDSPGAFAVLIASRRMLPSIPPGSYVIGRQYAGDEIAEGDMVIVDRGGRFFVGIWCLRQSGPRVRFLNAGEFDPIEIDENDLISRAVQIQTPARAFADAHNPRSTK